jgi:hypothetical protein
MIGVGLAALACCAQAFALSRADAKVGGRIVQSASIQVITPMVLPSVTATAVSPNAAFAGTVPSAGTGGTTAGVGNATLTIRSEVGDALSMAVPESFTVVRNGGTEALTVRTNTRAEYGLQDGGVILGGAVMGSNSMSVNVGGALSLASADRLEPGAYEGLLVVVVQYN